MELLVDIAIWLAIVAAMILAWEICDRLRSRGRG
jgi:hypothetical protein